MSESACESVRECARKREKVNDSEPFKGPKNFKSVISKNCIQSQILFHLSDVKSFIEPLLSKVSSIKCPAPAAYSFLQLPIPVVHRT